jgi:C-1 hydroxylase
MTLKGPEWEEIPCGEVMSAESNKEIVRTFLALWKKRDLAGMSKFWSPNMVHYARTGTYGSNEVFQLIGGFTEAFPDLEFEVEEMIAEGDFVSTRMRATATHQHDFMGITATGKSINCSAFGMVRIENGKIVEHWSVMDEIYLFQQLGLIPDSVLSMMAST